MQETKRSSSQTSSRLMTVNLGNVKPTAEQVKCRQQKVIELQGQRSWCNLCTPNKLIPNTTARNKHRAEQHKLPPEGRLVIHCNICDRDIHSHAYSKHLCKGEEAPQNQLKIQCDKCNGFFSKDGFTKHHNRSTKKRNISNPPPKTNVK